MTFRNLVAVTGTVFILTSSVVSSACGQSSFEGKTIRIVTNSSVGGTPDVLCRQFAPFISNYLPGNPTIVIENRPGAGGIIAANYLFNAVKPDGLTIGFFFGITTQGLIGGGNIRFDPAKFRWLGAIPQTHILLARKDLKLSAPRDLLKPALPLVLANSAANSTNDMANRLFLDMIGATYKHVLGFPGQPEQILALSRGEVSLANAGLTLYLSRRNTILQEGVYDAIVQRGEFGIDGTFQRNRLVPEMPTAVETIAELNAGALNSVPFAAYRTIVGALRVHLSFVVPPGTDDPTVRTLREAISRALNDSEAKASIRDKFKSEYDFLDGPMSESLVAHLRSEFDANPRINALISQLMARRKGE